MAGLCPKPGSLCAVESASRPAGARKQHSGSPLQDKHVVFFSWRDTFNPEGGGAERYLEQMAIGLVERGARVTIFTASYDAAPADEFRDGIRYVRRGSKLSIYLRGLLCLALRTFGHFDVIVDVQNGLPFFTRLLTRKPVVVLVHHVHKEQWPVVYPGLTGKIGWWIESRFAPLLYRRCKYIAVSEATRSELTMLGVDADRISVVRNGTDPVIPSDDAKTSHPSLCVVGRLVPHKQVEHAIDTAVSLSAHHPELTLRVVGDPHEGILGEQHRTVLTSVLPELLIRKPFAQSRGMHCPEAKLRNEGLRQVLIDDQACSHEQEASLTVEWASERRRA